MIVPENSSPAPHPQVFVAGGGTIGKNLVERLAVHYASPHSGYGPPISGDEGISYLTLRAVGDTGAWYLNSGSTCGCGSGSRRPMRRLLRTSASTVAGAATADTRDADRAGRRWAGCLAGSLASKPEHAGTDSSEAGGGRFYGVTQGSLLITGEALAALATVFVSSEESLELCLGKDGLEVLVLQFPAEASSSFIDAMILDSSLGRVAL